MQNSGESEFSGDKQEPARLTFTFWQSFLLTLAGAAGFISLVADGPSWLTYSGLGLVVILVIWILATNFKKKS